MNEQQDVLMRFAQELSKATGDGGRKRAAGTKPAWFIDDSHEAAMFSHLTKWKKGEMMDRDSGAHPLVHLAWRALAIACTETGNVPEARKETSVNYTTMQSSTKSSTPYDPSLKSFISPPHYVQERDVYGKAIHSDGLCGTVACFQPDVHKHPKNPKYNQSLTGTPNVPPAPPAHWGLDPRRDPVPPAPEDKLPLEVDPVYNEGHSGIFGVSCPHPRCKAYESE